MFVFAFCPGVPKEHLYRVYFVLKRRVAGINLVTKLITVVTCNRILLFYSVDDCLDNFKH